MWKYVLYALVNNGELERWCDVELFSRRPGFQQYINFDHGFEGHVEPLTVLKCSFHPGPSLDRGSYPNREGCFDFQSCRNCQLSVENIHTKFEAGCDKRPNRSRALELKADDRHRLCGCPFSYKGVVAIDHVDLGGHV